MFTKIGVLLRVAWAEVLVYRAEAIIWVLTGLLPLVMLAVWRTLAGDGNIAGYSGDDFVAYFVGALAIRQLTGVWVIWDIEREVRMGELSPHLLRPLHPLLRYFVWALSDKPLRVALVAPMVAIALLLAPGALPQPGGLSLALLPLAIVLGFGVYFCMQCCIGLLSFWFTQVLALHDFWFGLYALASGYVVPLDLFPPAVTQVLVLLPFRALLGFPLDLLLGKLAPTEIATGFVLQLFWLVVFFWLMGWLWQRGIRRYGAVGA
ncbi:MAG: ABC-2 family transporter protein [Chloroflexaceae bacterium]|nr:ABC-2 family transporter protein [Chloroflexaceae bacterium]